MKEASLAQILLERSKLQTSNLDLSGKGPLLPMLPPFLLKEMNQDEFRESSVHFEEFSDCTGLLKAYPDAKLKKGLPHEIFRFLQEDADVFLDFEQLGAVYLSRKTSGGNKPLTRMGQWLNYALSPELWGSEGKWTRFHEELQKGLERHKLLTGPSVPGYYPLNPETRLWRKTEVEGDRSEKSFTLILPWSFSLSELRKLMIPIIEEPSCSS